MVRMRWGVLLVGIVAGSIALLASRAGAWLQPVEAEEGAGGDVASLLPALREEPVVHPGAPIDPWRLPEQPRSPTLQLWHGDLPGAAVQYLRRCDTGDLLLTVERRREGSTRVVVRRRGHACFALIFPDGPDRSPASVRLHGTVDPTGGAGPLAIVHALSLPPRRERDGVVVRREALRLHLFSPEGVPLLERVLEASAAGRGSAGGAVTLTPLIWDGATRELLVWSSARRWEAEATQCLGSLLRVGRRGPVAVAEGLPCTPIGITAEPLAIRAATEADDGPVWQAVVDGSGDLLEVEASSPVKGPFVREAPLAFDWDGDGGSEAIHEAFGSAQVEAGDGAVLARLPGRPLGSRVDGASRELLVERLPCGIEAVAADGGRRCAPGDLGVILWPRSVGRAFDWTGDGTPDVTAIGQAPDGSTWVAAWAEGDLTFAWPLVEEEEGTTRFDRPLHQVPRALELTGGGGPEVLVATPRGFAVRAVPDGAVRWEGQVEDGFLDAWALPAGGPGAVAPR